MKTNPIKQIMFALIAISLGLTAINVFCIFLAGNNYIKLDLVNSSNYRDSYGWFIPDQKKRMLFPGLDGYELTINKLGLRYTGVDYSLDNLKDFKTRILTLGDSVTFGLFVNDEDTYPYLLQDMISEKSKNAVVLNAGVGGSTIRDDFDYLKRRGMELKPDVVVVNFCGNDLSDLKRENPYYVELMNDPPKGFNRLFKETAFYRSILSLYVHFKYKRWVSKSDDPKVREILNGNLNDVPSVVYVSENYHAFSPVMRPFDESLKAPWAKYFDILKEMSDYLKERGVKLIFIIQPEIVSIFEKTNGSHEDLIKGVLTANGIDYIDIVPALKRDRDNVLSYYNSPPRDFHLSRKGYTLFAEEVYRLIEADL